MNKENSGNMNDKNEENKESKDKTDKIKKDIKEKNKKDKTVKDFKGTWRKVIDYFAPYRVSFILSLILSIIGAVLNIFTPRIAGKAMNLLSQGSNLNEYKGIDFDALIKILAVLFVMYSAFALVSCISNYLSNNISVQITYMMRDKMSKKINRLPMSYFDKETKGEIISRLTNDVDVLVSSLTQTLIKTISSISMVLGTACMMFSLSLEMSGIAVLTVPISFIFISIIFKISIKYFKQYQIKLGNINGHIEEIYSGHSIVKAFNGEQDAIEKFDTLNKDLYSLAWKSEFVSGFVAPVMEIISNLSYIALCIMGGYLAVTKGFPIGNIFAFIVYLNQFMKPFMSAVGLPGTLQQIAVSAERVFEFIELKEDIRDKKDCIKIFDKDFNIAIKGDIKFKDVIFGYDKNNIVINKFSLDVKAGQKVAIVGATGAGKTTIIKLLSRFYDVDEGSILIDGYDIRDFKRKDLQTLFGIVFQEPWLFSGTVLENIRYGKMGSSDEEVKRAASLAYADSFISSLPDGYNTMIDESCENISTGEKQLLTIARAILANRKILILDEATSSVDTGTELNIQKALNFLLKDKTAFIIAHRLSTIYSADIIVVLDKGTIVEKGTHEELFNNKGLYYNMYISQFENGK